MFEVSDCISKVKTLNRRDLLIFLIPFIVFSLYLYVFNPGILAFDSYNQLHQIATGQFDSWHPFFHTFIEMMCLKVYGSPASVAVLQIVTFSAFWMIICKYNRDDSQKDKRTFAIQLAITLVIALIPINPIFSLNLQKDILFSYFLLMLCFMMEVLVDRRGNVGYSFAIVLSIVLAFIAQLRYNGMVLVLVFLVILAIWMYLKNTDIRLVALIPALTIVFILLIASLNIAYDVEEHRDDALCLMVGHMLADYDMNHKIDASDEAKLHKFVDKNKSIKYYNVLWKDPTRNNILHKDVWKEDKGTYIKMAIDYSFKHPMHFITYLLNAAPIVWQITRDADWQHANGGVYNTNNTGHRDGFYDKRNKTPAAGFDNATSVNIGTPQYDALNNWVNFAKDNIVLDTIFDSPALYMYLAIIILAVLFWITRLRDLWLIYLPNLLNIAIVFVSIPAQLNRYLYPNLLVCYLLVIILVGILIRRKAEAV